MASNGIGSSEVRDRLPLEAEVLFECLRFHVCYVPAHLKLLSRFRAFCLACHALSSPLHRIRIRSVFLLSLQNVIAIAIGFSLYCLFAIDINDGNDDST
ncbi:hypothetical protein BDW74DRAFT_26617 [Aspergillus multicolor]|uniref:uncharacterized protein n=1 Tax=Aspergillus multicolor TaxID=41759 RepID=UPI003CCE29C8